MGDGFVHEMVVRHELQHTETMRQTMALAGLLPAGEPPSIPLAGADSDWIEIPAGSFAMGAGPDGFAYDNERPRHKLSTGAFRIARRPVSNASWLRFSEGGGYERREWWSDEGWAWKEEYDITHHPDAAAGNPRAPVCHVSWFEADAFARANAARLPSEAEWERAAARTEQHTRDTGAAAIASRRGALEDVGRVWSGPRAPSTVTPALRRTPIASTPRCSSARTIVCCAAAPGPRARAWRA